MAVWHRRVPFFGQGERTALRRTVDRVDERFDERSRAAVRALRTG
jgi:hypothetical protein